MIALIPLATCVALSLAADPAADSVSLRDGKVILGQVIEPPPRGKILVLVRRAWAETNLPDRFRTWQAAEAPSLKRSRDERIKRLEAWKRERAAEPNDAILAWIDAEMTRLKAGNDTPKLMLVTLNRGDVRGLVKRPPDSARRLRQAWRAGFDDAETKAVDALTSNLEGRGFAITGNDPAPIDDLLPTPPETEAQWRFRRAATEVAQDRTLRFIRHQGMILPEGQEGAGIDAKAIGGLVKSLLGEAGEAEDPLVAKGKEVSARGRVGLMVTTLETTADLSGVTVEVVLYAKVRDDRWERAAARMLQVRGNDVKAGEGANVAADPQVQSIFKAAEGLGLEIPADLKAKSLNMGAATQKALGQARTAIQPDLDALNLMR